MRDARRAAGCVLAVTALAAVTPVGAPAQTPEQPNLIFTISGGILTGGQLWHLPLQLAFPPDGAGNAWDSVSLGRQLRPGFAATLQATYFRSPHLGYTLEAGFFGIETESACSLVGQQWAPSGLSENRQACTYIQGQAVRGDAVGFLAGVIWRFTTRGNQPYIRVAGGGAILGSSYVDAVAPVLAGSGTTNTVYFLADQNHKEVTWMLSLGAGAMLPLGPGYQLRIEARDLIVALPRPTGPATDTAAIANSGALPQPPIGIRVMHVPTLMVGLDVVLERRRGHRY